MSEAESEPEEIGEAVLTCGTFEWQMNDFYVLSNDANGCYWSPTFDFADITWYLCLYPRGITTDSHAWIALELVRHGSGLPKAVNFKFGIKLSNGVEVLKELNVKFSKKYDCCKVPDFLSRSNLSKRKTVLMPNNVLTITCDMRCSTFCDIEKDLPSASINKPAFSGPAVLVGEKICLKSFLSLLESGDDSDIIIKVQGKEFPTHKAILRARSPVFNSMFAHNMSERNSGVVNIEDCDPAVFHDFLVYVYSGSYDQISSKNVHNLYSTADKYDVGDLKVTCSDFMKRNITIECFCDVLKLALKHNDKDLIEYVTNFFCDNSVNIGKTTAWQTFLAENLTVGNELFVKAMSRYTAQ